MQSSKPMSFSIPAIVASVLLVSVPRTAAAGYSGAVTGSFVAPVLSGAFLLPESREPFLQDNAAIAPTSGAGTATITWGRDGTGCPAADNSVTFVGDVFNDVMPGEVIRLGTLTFVNGLSGPASLIFGFDMQLSAGDDIAPFTGLVDVISTQNANVDPIADADVLSFPDFDAPSTLAAFESASVTAIVNGTIGDDGRLRVTSIELAPGEDEHGCVDAAAVITSQGPCASAE
jgi:hypothetical protein